MSADLAVLTANTDLIERAADPAAYVVLACERAKAWLADALEHGDIDGIVELKSQAEAIRVYTAQKQLGKDAELSAQEIVRRAERGIGVAIRRGQDAGEILKRSENLQHANQYSGAAIQDGDSGTRRSPREFIANSNEYEAIYAMTDDVTDGDFEDAIGEARGEENLSRANVVRKVRGITSGETPTGRRVRIAEMAASGQSSRQIAEAVGILATTVRKIARENGIDIPADQVIGRARQLDSNRIVRETVYALEGLSHGVSLVRVADLDYEEVGDWVASLNDSIRALNRLIKQMKEATP